MWWDRTNLISSLRSEFGDEATRRYLREKFKRPENKIAFGYLCFPHHFTVESPSFHTELFGLFGSPSNVGIAAPRNHAKSTLLMVDNAFDIVNGNVHYLVYISDSFTQALEHTETLKAELEGNEILTWLYGTSETDSWAAGEFITTGGTKVVAKGQSMKIRGLKYRQYRPDKIVIDDLENDEMVEKFDRREKLKRWFKLGVMPALDVGGRIIMIGTILHGDSLLSKIVDKSDEFSGWTTKIYKAINRKDGKEYSLWPQQWPLEKLNAIKSDPKHPKYIGSNAFSQEYQNKPLSSEDAVVKLRWIKIKDKDFPAMKRIVIPVDPAISKKEKADFSAIQAWGLGIDDSVYCLEAIRGRWSFTELGKEIRAMYHRHSQGDIKVSEILIEEVAYQAAIKENPKLKDLPVVGVRPEKDKRTRLVVNSKWYEAGEVYFKSTMDNLKDEVVNFGTTAHDDECDASNMGIFRLKGGRGKITAANIGFV